MKQGREYQLEGSSKATSENHLIGSDLTITYLPKEAAYYIQLHLAYDLQRNCDEQHNKTSL